MLEHLVRRLESFSALSEPEMQTVRAMFSGSRRTPAGEDIVHEGESSTSVSLMLEGLACRYKTMSDGRRQIMGFLLPGDLIDLHGFMAGQMDHSVGSLTPCKLAVASHQKLQEALEQNPGLARSLWAETMAEGAVSREWLVGLGRRSAYSRIAHLLCEVVARMKKLGLTDGSVCDLPVTQQELADSLGLSLVHVNRVLQRLRGSGLVSLGRGALKVHDWDGLQQAGDFDPSYLSLNVVKRQSKSIGATGNLPRA
jgi:CRP-like cAMP-binding protein